MRSFEPCMCGGCERCGYGPELPDACPICGKDNFDVEADEFLDTEYGTCGAKGCRAQCASGPDYEPDDFIDYDTGRMS